MPCIPRCIVGPFPSTWPEIICIYIYIYIAPYFIRISHYKPYCQEFQESQEYKHNTRDMQKFIPFVRVIF